MPSPAPDLVVVLVTCPLDRSGPLARALVQERLVACVNRLPEVTSVYRWEGEVQEDSESLLVMKTTSKGFPRLRDRVLELHPYDLPEILALPVVDGLPGYLSWVVDEVSP